MARRKYSNGTEDWQLAFLLKKVPAGTGVNQKGVENKHVEAVGSGKAWWVNWWDGMISQTVHSIEEVDIISGILFALEHGYSECDIEFSYQQSNVERLPNQELGIGEKARDRTAIKITGMNMKSKVTADGAAGNLADATAVIGKININSLYVSQTFENVFSGFADKIRLIYSYRYNSIGASRSH